MKKQRVLVLMHEDLVPPESMEGYSDQEMLDWKTEFDVVSTVREMKHEVRPLGVFDDLGPLREAIQDWKPSVAFNLLEEFHGVGVYDHHVVSYLELMKQPYTGCNPRGLLLAHDKILSKKILTYHRIPNPRFLVFPRDKTIRPPKNAPYPLLVKSASEEASLGIAQDSIVSTDEKLKERVEFIHDKIKTDALVEEYIEGRELYVGVFGNRRLQTLPIWEMLFTKAPPGMAQIATAKVKWDVKYQKKLGIETRAAEDLPNGVDAKIKRLCKRIYRALNLSGYARMDLRMTPEGKVYVLEANPNPNLSFGEDFSESAEKAGISYESLLQKIINLGIRYKAAWQS